MPILTAKIQSKEHLVKNYLEIFNGGLKLTDKEFDIVKEFVLIYLKYSEDGVKEPTLSEFTFSNKNIQRVKTVLDISKQNWNNYRNKIIEKKAVIEKDGELFLNPVIIPQEEITFKFIKTYENGNSTK